MQQPWGEMLWEDDFCRVVALQTLTIRVSARVIVRRHVAEMTDLSMDERSRLMSVVSRSSRSFVLVFAGQDQSGQFRERGSPFALARHSRWRDDRHFPQPIWGSAQRVSSPARAPVPNFRLAEIGARIAQYGKGEGI